LNQLHERGDLARRKVSNRVLYWRPADETGPHDSAKDSDTDSSMPTIEDGLNPDAVRQDVVSDE
jgi:hypothetical protein